MKNWAKVLFAAVGLALTCGLAAVYWFYYPIYQIQNIVRDALKDSDSAKFSRVMFDHQTNAGCGQVNAKNQLGGYVGSKVFVASLGGKKTFLAYDQPFVSFDPEATAPDLPPEKPKPSINPIDAILSMNSSWNSFVANQVAKEVAEINLMFDRDREIDKHKALVAAAAYKNEAFKDLVNEKCPGFGF